MSQAEIERFVEDLKNDEGLRDELSSHASGVGSIVGFAKSKGYDVTAAEASTYIQAQAGRDLSDAELDAVAGGKGHHSTNTATVQTAVTATTEATAAETTTTAAAEAEVAAAAVAVVVLT